ncbi:MAG: enoyl-CoA hydratase/isomerase family protein [Pikeienuella sp.]
MSDISIRIEGRAGRITLTRPQALNSLTADMLGHIGEALTAWEHDDAVSLVLIDAEGDRAFAAGGDIVDLYNTGRAGDYSFGQRFWADEYRLNARIKAYPKPYVAVMHGFTMGGGVGVSALGSHRIVTDSSQIAMPEVGIGLVPDVGGSKLLAHAPGACGAYLGMTTTRMGAADAIYAGFADAYVSSEKLAGMKARLCETGDVGVITEYYREAPAGVLAPAQAEIDAMFGRETAQDVEAALAASGTEWAAKALKAMRKGCPLSVACALPMIRAAKDMTWEQALAQEYRFTARCMEHGEFLEGIRAAVIDKDRDPKWAKPTLADVSEDDVAFMLSELPGGDLAF